MRSYSLLAMLPFAGILAIVAVGQTVVIQQRGLDLSATGMMALAGLVVAKTDYMSGSLSIALGATLVVASIGGSLNGFLVTRVNITPLVATLAVNAILVGAVRSISNGIPVPVPEALDTISHARLLGLPNSLVVGILFIAAVSVLIRRSLVGRRFVAVGANPRTARAAGVAVLRYQVGAYIGAAICFAAAGVLFAGFIGSASATAANNFLLPSIAAVVVGGTPFTGGRGSVVASGVAALFLTQLGQLVLALGAPASTQLLVQALAIIGATGIRHLPHVTWRRRGNRRSES
jgi:ribose transport system permease protein